MRRRMLIVLFAVAFCIASMPPAEPSYAGRTLKEWQKALEDARFGKRGEDKDEEKRCAELEAAFLAMGAPALDALVAALKKCDPEITNNVVCLVRKIGKPAVYRLLTELRSEKSPWAVYLIASVLGKTGNDVMPILEQALSDDNELVRAGAGWALGFAAKKESLPWLLNAMKDSSQNVRRAAAWALGSLGGEKATSALQQALEKDVYNVAEAAMDALYRIKGKEFAPELRRMLYGKYSYLAMNFLAKLRDEKAVPALVGKFRNEPRSAAHIAEVLMKIGGEKVADAMREIVEDKKAWSRRIALRTYIASEKKEKATPVIIKMLKDEDLMVRVVAAGGVANLYLKDAVPELITMLSDKAPEARGAAAMALQSIQAQKAVPELIAAFNRDKDWNARERLASALCYLKDIRALEIMKSAVKDKSDSIRMYAVLFMYIVKAEGCDEILAEALLNDPHPVVRYRASNALRRIGHKNAAHVLVKALGDKHPAVRSHVSTDIIELDDKSVLPKVVEFIANSKDQAAKGHAIRVLGALCDETHVPALVKALELNDPGAKAKAAAAALKIIKNKDSKKSNALWTNWWVWFRRK